MKKTKSKVGLFVLSALMICGTASMMASCGGDTSSTTSAPTTSSTSSATTSEEKVDVKEVALELSKQNAKVGEKVTANVTIRPSNATNKEYSLSSSDETVATIVDGKINCLAAGTVTITARSKDNTTKKSEAKLVVLGTDEQGRTENIFEAEEGNIVASNGSSIKIEATADNRVSGTGVVGSLSKGDRVIWGVNSSEQDDNAELKIKLMGPSGWVGMWDSIPYTFADWYTVKVNGKTINTEDIKFEGTTNKGGSADYYNIQTMSLGKIKLVKGLNVITFVVSNRFDQTKINDETYSGTINCWGNLDSILVLSSKDLTSVANTEEVDNADPDVNYQSLTLEAESDKTRIYKDAENPNVNIGTASYVEFEKKMNVMFGVKAAAATRVKLNLKIAAPYVNATTKMEDVALSDIASLNIDGKRVSLDGLTLKGNDATNKKDNFTSVVTGWVDLNAGNNVIVLVVKGNTKYEYLGGLDALTVQYIDGSLQAYLNEEPSPEQTYRFEAEADTTKRIGYDELPSGATDVEFIQPKKVQTDVYNNKTETKKIIYGIESNVESYATIKMRVAAPYLNTTDKMEDVSVGNLGDLWFNGTIVSTPNTLYGNDKVGVKNNYTEFEVEIQVLLSVGKNRIAWEPQNYTGKDYAFNGALDYIEVTTSSSLTAYEVNMWTDRNSYFDDTNNEPIYVTCDSALKDGSWIGLYHTSDYITNASHEVGSLYYYYPSQALNTAVDITKQNPNSERQLIDGKEPDGYGSFKILYFANGDYEATDTVYISCWNDPSLYGGLVANN